MFIFFIGESIGWQELILIGTLALIFLGPRKLPQIVKTIGKTMAEFRNMGQEFKSTWEREASLEDEEKSILKNPFDENLVTAEEKYKADENTDKQLQLPVIKEVSEKEFSQIINEKTQTEKPVTDTIGKRDWL